MAFRPVDEQIAYISKGASEIIRLDELRDKLKRSRAHTFTRICRATSELSSEDGVVWPPLEMASRSSIPHFTEPWYCCAEPTRDQFVSIAGSSPPLARPDAFL